jgi:flagellar biosynthesis protein FlhF
MKAKTFHALTMPDALRSIKEELGPDAIIFSLKEAREGDRLLRLFNRPVLEVMAACEQDVPAAMLPCREGAPESGAHPSSVEPAVPSPTSRRFHSTLRSVLEPAAVSVAPAVVAPAGIHVLLASSGVPHLTALTAL